MNQESDINSEIKKIEESTTNLINEPSENKIDSNDDEDEGITYKVTGLKFFMIIIALCIICLLACLDSTVVTTALPIIAKDFGDISSYAWVLIAYMLSSTALQPMYGKLSDIFGRHIIILITIVLFIVSSIFCGLSNSMTMLIIFRAIQGIGGGGLMSLCMIVIADIVPFRKRGLYMGIISAVFSFSYVLGPLVGGLFTDYISWHWAFFINVPLGLIAFFIIFFYFKMPTTKGNIWEKLCSIDYAGTLAMVGCVVCLLLALQWGGINYSWTSWQIILLFGLFALFFVIFLIIENKFAKEPIIPLEMFKVRNIVCMIITITLLGFAYQSSCNYIPLYFQMVQGKSATVSGLMMTPMAILITVLNIGSGIIIGKYGHVNLMFIVGFLLSAASGYAYSLFDLDTTIIIQLLIVAFGSFGYAQDSSPKELVASTTTVISFFQVIGGIIGISVFTTILNNRVPSLLHDLNPSINAKDVNMKLIHTYGPDGLKAYNYGLRFNYLLGIPCSLLALLACLFTKNVRLNKKPQKSTESSSN
ncbi:MFS general substrate transporter [Anaeromyces robustus]|uniref:MFS general substrate transporter n=1 Tax=Anaeromyces robustus TaxID=1754192 RepID=A0A1Y1VVJ6_9FUNG|nr:MFS general substrate transporter [Anaeromyces robustus]|eukprot:ORX65322.1 MFS general substrate transporter [Anaeromyces robustus]